MPYYACKGAKLKCSMGSEQSDLGVTQLVYLCGEAMANIMDHKPLMNIKPFGQCKSLANPTVAAATAANNGRLQKMPCVPNTPSHWLNSKKDVLVKGHPALVEASKCLCEWKGVIEITDPGQKVISYKGHVSQEFVPASAEADEMGTIATQGGNALASQGPEAGSAGAGGPATSHGIAASGSQASQGAGMAAVPSALFVKKVEGAAETYPRQKIVYKVTEYNKKRSEMNGEERSKEIKWAVRVGDSNNDIHLTDKGEKITLDIKDGWENKNISVMAYIENLGEASQKTKVLQDNFKGTLIRGVVGEDEAAPGQEIRYDVINSNKDGEAGAMNDSDIKWDVKLKREGKPPERILNGSGKGILEETRGNGMLLDIKKEWLGGEAIVMPFLKSPTETVSVKTKIVSLGSKVAKMLEEMQRNGEKQEIILKGGLYARKLMNDINSCGMDAEWLREIEGCDMEVQIGNRLESPVKKTNGFEQERLDDETLGLTLGIIATGTTERKTFIKINLNNDFFKDKAGLGGEELQKFDKQLQIILLHEFVHAWQTKTGRVSIDRERRVGDRMNRNGTRNIFTESEAYNIQFEFENKIDVRVNSVQIDNIRNFFDNIETEEMKAHYLSTLLIFQKHNFALPSAEELEANT